MTQLFSIQNIMNLTNPQRIIKLLGNLFMHPSLIPKYINHNFINKNLLPMDLGYPWWSYNAIFHVDKIVKGKKIFEYGTGGSTIRYSKLAKSIVSVEDDLKWFEMMNKKLAEQKITNVNLLYVAFDFRSPKNFGSSEYLNAVNNGDFDIIIIDGQDHTFQERITCFRHVEPMMKPGQYIIMDDYWRYEELSTTNNAKKLLIFESVGPGRYGVTSTAIFVY